MPRKNRKRRASSALSVNVSQKAKLMKMFREASDESEQSDNWSDEDFEESERSEEESYKVAPNEEGSDCSIEDPFADVDGEYSSDVDYNPAEDEADECNSSSYESDSEGEPVSNSTAKSPAHSTITTDPPPEIHPVESRENSPNMAEVEPASPEMVNQSYEETLPAEFQNNFKSATAKQNANSRSEAASSMPSEVQQCVSPSIVSVSNQPDTVSTAPPIIDKDSVPSEPSFRPEASPLASQSEAASGIPSEVQKCVSPSILSVSNQSDIVSTAPPIIDKDSVPSEPSFRPEASPLASQSKAASGIPSEVQKCVSPSIVSVSNQPNRASTAPLIIDKDSVPFESSFRPEASPLASQSEAASDIPSEVQKCVPPSIVSVSNQSDIVSTAPPIIDKDSVPSEPSFRPEASPLASQSEAASGIPSEVQKCVSPSIVSVSNQPNRASTAPLIIDKDSVPSEPSFRPEASPLASQSEAASGIPSEVQKCVSPSIVSVSNQPNTASTAPLIIDKDSVPSEPSFRPEASPLASQSEAASGMPSEEQQCVSPSMVSVSNQPNRASTAPLIIDKDSVPSEPSFRPEASPLASQSEAASGIPSEVQKCVSPSIVSVSNQPNTASTAPLIIDKDSVPSEPSFRPEASPLASQSEAASGMPSEEQQCVSPSMVSVSNQPDTVSTTFPIIDKDSVPSEQFCLPEASPYVIEPPDPSTVTSDPCARSPEIHLVESQENSPTMAVVGPAAPTILDQQSNNMSQIVSQSVDTPTNDGNINVYENQQSTPARNEPNVTAHENLPSTSAQPSSPVRNEQNTTARNARSPGEEDTWEDTTSDIPYFEFDNTETGPTVPLDDETSPINILDLLFTDELINHVVACTNAYGAALCNTTRPHTRGSRKKSFKPTDPVEMKKFLGLCMLQGHIDSPSIRHLFTATDPLYYHPLFPFVMSGRRFEQLLRCLCISELNSKGMNKVKVFAQKVIRNFQTLNRPGKQLSLDESMLPFRGRLAFRQYMKAKKNKYGIKFYVLTTYDGYVLNFVIYEGKNTLCEENATTSKLSRLVMKLMGPYLHKGHELFMDNFYNSVELSRKLLHFKTHTTGTLRKDRKENPKEIFKKPLKKGEHVWQRKGKVYVSMWKDKRPVHMITTKHHPHLVLSTNRRKQIRVKPVEVDDYNMHMSGIDRSDQMMAYYSTPKKTIRWYKKVLFRLLDMMIWNGHYIHKKHCDPQSTLLSFREAIISSYLQVSESTLERLKKFSEKRAHASRRKRPDAVQAEMEGIRHWPEFIPQRENSRRNKTFLKCRVCTKNKISKLTSFRCKGCEVKPPLCPTCFETWHTNPEFR